MTMDERRQPHALFLPFPGIGHVNPMLHFAHRLISFGDILVTFVYSSSVYHRLQLRQPNIQEREEEQWNANGQHQQRHLFRVEVVSDGLPTDEKYSPTLDEFWNSLEVIQKAMEDLLRRSIEEDNHPVSCIISDTFLFWTHDLAKKFSLPRAQIWSASAGSYSIGKYIPLLISEGLIPYKGQNDMITCIPGLFPMRGSDFPKAFLTQDTSDRFFQLLLKAFEAAKEAEWTLLNTVYELERSVVDSLRADSVNVYTVGPLLPHDINITSGFIDNETCLQWLDTQTPLSVIYVAFGTVASLSASEVQALAEGLELSQQPFLLVLRSASFIHLPDTFITHTERQGLIVPWAPQLQVLSHSSVGGFISHCGWNSIMESCHAGVPIIGWPKLAEQNTNLKFITEMWKVGIAMEAWEEGESGPVSKERVEKAVRTLLKGEEGRAARKKVGEIRETLQAAVGHDGSSRRDVEEFIADMHRRTAHQ